VLIEPDDAPLADILSVIERLHEGDLAAKVMIVPRAGPERPGAQRRERRRGDV
jgi:hypothetical protein